MKEFPRLKVIAAHLGGYKAWDEAHELAACGGENIMFDTSSALWAITTERANQLISMLGSERVMFGTDYPVMYAENELNLFMKIKLTDEERQNILYGNAKNFLKFEKR